MVKTAKKASAKPAEWEFVTEVASHSKPNEVHWIDRRIAGEQFAFMLHGTPVRCTCKGFVFKTKNGSGEPCRHLDYFVTRPHAWKDTLEGAQVWPDAGAPIPAIPTATPIDTFSVDVHEAIRSAFGKAGPVLIPVEHGPQWQGFIAKLRLIVSAAGAPTKAALTSAIANSFEGATRKRRIVLVD